MVSIDKMNRGTSVMLRYNNTEFNGVVTQLNFHAPTVGDEAHCRTKIGEFVVDWRDDETDDESHCRASFHVSIEKEIFGFTYLHFVAGTKEYTQFRTTLLSTDSQNVIKHKVDDVSREFLQRCRSVIREKRKRKNIKLQTREHLMDVSEDIQDILDSGEFTKKQMCDIKEAAYNACADDNEEDNEEEEKKETKEKNKGGGGAVNPEKKKQRKKKEWKCEECSSVFTKAIELNEHCLSENHHGVLVKCKDCGSNFASQQLAFNHAKYSHASRIKTGVICRKKKDGTECSGELMLARAWNGNTMWKRWG
eukprot:369530_1